MILNIRTFPLEQGGQTLSLGTLKAQSMPREVSTGSSEFRSETTDARLQEEVQTIHDGLSEYSFLWELPIRFFSVDANNDHTAGV